MSISEKTIEKLTLLYEKENTTVHFFWNCKDSTTDTLGGCLYFPADTENPFLRMREMELISPEFLSLYDVFCAKLLESTVTPISETDLGTVVRMKFSNDGEARLCNIYVNLLKDENGIVTDMHVNIRPFSQKEEFNAQVLDMFTSDKNPSIFSAQCKDILDRTEEGKLAFIQFDVERFNLINDTYGTETGDEILKFFSDSLNILCEENQPHCRLTADVFMVLKQFDDKQEIIDFIRMLESRLSFYKEIEYRFAFGVCITGSKDVPTRRYGDNAGLARRTIKGNALQNIAFYENDMIGKLHKKQTIEEDMHKAVVNNEFVMFLQPKYSISNNKIIGAEALARWIHPEKGMISPADFIPVFEQNGFIIKLDRIIWEQACRKLREWLDKGITPVPISVNVSREYLSNTDIVEIITELVKKYSIPPQLLELEITESIDSENVKEVVQKFKSMGFTMLMDDFGSGYSSLNVLKTTQFDVLKIDRGFFSEFMESDRGRKIISHTISMSQDIGLGIVAEGVETTEQATFLSDCGCDTAQGFLYSRPVPVEEFEKMFIGT
ncbi:MAG: EAL domain-containing protein [Ruminiclostridium sp.]|nr:EAL domain-containing protein [Ruminiclostridium sp.]